MAYTKQQLKKDLEQLGVHSGDVVLMHSSFKALGEIEGGAAGFFDLLQTAVGIGVSQFFFQ